MALAVATVSLVASLAGAFVCSAQEAATPGARGPIPTVTRLVSLFGSLERGCLEAIRKRDVAALEALLADDFEMRAAARPDQPIPRADWVKQALAGPVVPWVVGRMAARDLGAVVLVSFRLQHPQPASGSGSAFVVDAWVQVGGAWKIAARYVGDVEELPEGVPTDVETPDTLPQKH